MPEENVFPRWEVINETIKSLDNTLVGISNQLVGNKELPLSIYEVELALKQLQRTIDRELTKAWASELTEETPSPQMSQSPRGPLYG